MVQTSDGFAFSWGAGKDGQLGLDEMRMETSPVLLEVRLPRLLGKGEWQLDRGIVPAHRRAALTPPLLGFSSS